MNKKGNQQFQQTDQHIQDTMMSLLEKKNARKITVRELCEAADINRSTFYAHYLDIYDLLEKMNEVITRQMVEATRQKDLSPEEMYRAPYNFDFLEYIQENKTFYKAWLCFSPRILFKLGNGNLIEHIAYKRLEMGHVTSTLEQEYFIAYYSGGMDAIIRIWLESDCRESAETIRGLMKRCYPKQKCPVAEGI